MLGKPASPSSCREMNLIRKQVIYWHWVCINTVMIFILPTTANCKVWCQFKQSCYFVLLCQEDFISSLGLTELESFFEKEVWSMYEVWKVWRQKYAFIVWPAKTIAASARIWACDMGHFCWSRHSRFCHWSVPSEAKLKIIVTPLQVWQICISSSPLEEEIKCSVSNMFVYKRHRSYLSE